MVLCHFLSTKKVGKKNQKAKKSILQSAFGCQLPQRLGAYLTARFASLKRCSLVSIDAFSLAQEAQRKSFAKRNAYKRFRRLRTATRASRPLPRRLLKKAGEKLPMGECEHDTLLKKFWGRGPFFKRVLVGCGAKPRTSAGNFVLQY